MIAVDLARALDQRANLWNTTLNPTIEDAERSFVPARDLRRWLGDDLLENSVTQDGDTVSNELLRSIVNCRIPMFRSRRAEICARAWRGLLSRTILREFLLRAWIAREPSETAACGPAGLRTTAVWHRDARQETVLD